MHRRQPLIVALLLAAFAVGCGGAETAAPPTVRPGLKKVVLQSDWFPQGEHGGFYQALAKGYYAEAGLDVDIWPGGPGSGIKLKVLRGDADFGLLRSDDVIMAASAGMPLVMVAAVFQHDPQAVMVHAASPVKTFADLDGRTVIGNVGMAWFPYLEKRYGIRIVRRQNTYGLGEFIADPETIQQCMVTNEPFFARQHGREVRTLPFAESGYDCYHTLFTRRETIRRSPEMVRAFVQASIRGWRDFIEKDPAPAFDFILKRNPQMTAELLAFSRRELIARKLVRGDPVHGEDIGRLSVKRLAEEIRTLRELEIIEQPITVTHVATTEFVPAAPGPNEKRS